MQDEKYRTTKDFIDQRKFFFSSVPFSTNFASTPAFCDPTEKSIDDCNDLMCEKNEWSFDSFENLLSPRQPV